MAFPAAKPARVAVVHLLVPGVRQARLVVDLLVVHLVVYPAAPADKPAAGHRRRHQVKLEVVKPEVDKQVAPIQQVGPARQAAALMRVAVQQAAVPHKQAVRQVKQVVTAQAAPPPAEQDRMQARKTVRQAQRVEVVVRRAKADRRLTARLMAQAQTAAQAQMPAVVQRAAVVRRVTGRHRTGMGAPQGRDHPIYP